MSDVHAASVSIPELAIDAGTPVRTRPFAPWPAFAEDEIAAAAGVLRSGRVNQWTGEQISGFETDYAKAVGRRHAVALMNGTVALELALEAYGIGAGDEVITTARTFIASASAVVMRGATPVIADVDRLSQNISVETIAPLVTDRTRAIIAVHLAGWPVDMPALMAFAEARGLIVIEDCAQAHGATIAGRPVGSFGHAAAFSFCQDKIITTGGEGGMLLLDDEERFRKAWAFKDHGKSYAAAFERSHLPGFRWLHESFGTNWRMTEMQAAIGRRQLGKLPDWVARRRANAARLDEAVQAIPGVSAARLPAAIGHARYKYYAMLDPDRLADGWTRDRIVASINAEGVPCFSGSCGEIYLERAFTDRGLGPAQRLPVARDLGERSLMFLVHPTLDETDMADTGGALAKIMRAAAR